MAYVNMVFSVGEVLTASDMNFLKANTDLVRIQEKGSGAPAAPVAGMSWLDDSQPIWELNFYTGSNWIPALTIDTSSGYADAGLAFANQRWGSVPMVRRDQTRTAWAGVPTFPKNMVLNGNMAYWQRGNSFAPTATRGYTADRWLLELTGGGRVAVQQSSFTPALQPGDWSLELRVLSARATAASGDNLIITQPVEGSVLARAAFGKSEARPTHVSFWLWSNVTGRLSFLIAGGSASINYLAPVDIGTASVWLYKEVAVPAPTSGSWQQRDNRTAAYVGLNFAAHSLFLTTSPGDWAYGTAAELRAVSGQLNGMNGVGTVFRVAALQWEVGETATPMEVLPESVEMQMLQRYYQKSFPLDVRPQVFGTLSPSNFMGTFRTSGDGTGYPSSSVRFPVIMRAAPAVAFYNPFTGSPVAWWNSTEGRVADVATASGYIWREGMHPNVVGNPTVGNANDSLHVHYTADAEAYDWS